MNDKAMTLGASATMMLFMAGGCGHIKNYFSEPELVLGAAAIANDIQVPAPPDPMTARPPSVLPGMDECIRQNGLRLKVVTTQPGLQCTKSPGGGELVQEDLRLFQELFVIDAGPDRARPDWYLVSKSPRREHTIGYLGADVVAIWPTRLGLRAIAPVLLYPNEESSAELAVKGRTSNQPLARADADVDRHFLPWPIGQSRTVTNHRGNVVEIAQIHVLGELSDTDMRNAMNGMNGIGKYSEPRKREILNAVSIITVAFCVDNTSSTEPFVPGIIRFIQNATNRIHDLRPQLRLALTLYRDDVSGLKWGDSVTKTMWQGKPQLVDEFLKQVRSVRAPNVSSEDWPECAFQGLEKTLLETNWESLSHKAIVWIGDNSAHPDGSRKNPEASLARIVELAKEKGVTIHAVCIKGGGGDDEQRLHYKQCHSISSQTGGHVFRLQDDTTIAERIAQAVSQERAIVRENVKDFKKIESGEMSYEEYLRSEDREELNRRYRFVRLLNAAGVDLSRLEPGVPAFAKGWVATQLPSGQPLFERMVYISRVELDVLLGELNHLVALLNDDSSKGVFQLFHTGVGARVGDHSFFSNRREGDIPFDAFMAAKGIPMRSGITMKTRDEILAMNAEEKILLKARLINEVIPKLTNARSSTAFKLTGDFDFGWIPESTLP